MTTYSYRVVRRNKELAVREVYFADDGRIRGITQVAFGPSMDSVEGLRHEFGLMLQALDYPIIQEPDEYSWDEEPASQGEDIVTHGKTIRELGGEVWAEIGRRFDDQLDWRLQARLAEIVMGVLARYSGKLIENDKDLPVAALPSTWPKEDI